MRKGFTTTELVVAVALLAAVMVISGSVFKMTIDAQRQAGAVAEITRNFRAITDQINRDFTGLVKDGYMIIDCNEITTDVFLNEQDENDGIKVSFAPRIDGISFFSTGDYHSTSVAGRKSNIALVSLNNRYSDPNNNTEYMSSWTLSRNARLLIKNESTVTNDPFDYDDTSFAEQRIDPNVIAGMEGWLGENEVINSSDVTENWKYFSGGVGDLRIQWTDFANPVDSNGVLNWQPDSTVILPEGLTVPSVDLWPRAIKFTMTLYDSKGVIPEGKTFTHIVYIGD